ncbi:hypothetical protein FACS1894205_2270 [Alphaproteobacteria bacterium]|nr:hypothetical protein FACS1894205_2270 [Alphaproteobacteria bacterium]
MTCDSADERRMIEEFKQRYGVTRTPHSFGADQRAPKPDDGGRRKFIAAIHAEKTRRGIDDTLYKAMLARLTGKESSKDCTIPQLRSILAAIKGGSPAPTRRARAESAHIRKARALWLSLYALGAVRDPSDKALASFAKRQLRIDALQWVKPSEASVIIEALKDWCAREGFHPGDDAMGELVTAQLGKLYPNGPAPEEVIKWANAAHGYDAINALGKRIRGEA